MIWQSNELFVARFGDEDGKRGSGFEGFVQPVFALARHGGDAKTQCLVLPPRLKVGFRAQNWTGCVSI